MVIASAYFDEFVTVLSLILPVKAFHYLAVLLNIWDKDFVEV